MTAAAVYGFSGPGLTPLTSLQDAREGGASVLSFSHFLPRIELIPEKRYLGSGIERLNPMSPNGPL